MREFSRYAILIPMEKTSPLLILLRHGQSAWNERNLFTGWVDIPLSQKGIDESIAAGEAIAHLPIDLVFTSSLIRSHMTLALALLRHQSGKVPRFLHTGEGKKDEWGKIYSRSAEEGTFPVHMAWQLNERMYGELQGLNKQETADRFGADQVHTWRRSFDIAPPGGESLKATAARTLPYFKEAIVPRLQEGKSLLIAAHGNSLRSIVMEIEQLSPEQVVSLELATGAPRIYAYRPSHAAKQGAFIRQ
jgi:2,3-bisphosphoglycerate-dependent phosphoglycerate mutase